MFKLTDEQIDYIIENYGGSKRIINNIEHELNMLGVIDDENDYFDVICEVVSQKETIRMEIEKCDTKREVMAVYMKNNQIIATVLNRKYNDFETSSYKKQEAMRKYI